MIKLENNFEFGFSHGSFYDRRRKFENNFRCYGGKGGDNASPQSTTTQSAQNYQVAAAPSASAIGANSSGNTVNVTTVSTDADVANAAIAASVVNANNSDLTVAHALDVNGAVAGDAIDANTAVAQGAIGVAGSSLAVVAQNDASTAAEINTQTALAFSTIDHLITGQTAGQEAAANQAAALQLQAAQGYGATNTAGANTPTIIYAQPQQNAPSGGLLTSGSTYNFVWIIAGALTIWYFVKGKKAA